MTVTVLLGDHELPVVAQRHARLRHLLTGQDLTRLVSGDYGAETYRVLCVLIPALHDAMPEWQWDGYADEQAWREGRYDPDTDRSPTSAEIVAAFKAAINVNGGDELGKLMRLAQQMGQITPQITPASPVSPGASGE